jgi:truncated hemoglobin YjbI
MPHNTPVDLLRHRIALLAIDQKTVDTLHRIAPFIESCLDGIIEDFYAHMQKFPEGRKLFSDQARVSGLKHHQKKHWTRLFSAHLDDDYLRDSIHIGKAHYQGRVAPHLYIAGYNFFEAALLKRVASRYQNDPQLPLMMEAIARVVGLDMDLALSVYLRELWRQQIEPRKAG